jgi:hypothetical protein
MIKHTLLNKCCTIFENSEFNTGLNPVAELNAGNVTSRILINFDLTDLKQSVLNNEVNISDLTHYIHMTNCGSANLPIFLNKVFVGCDKKTRAASFDVIAFRIPYLWDEGRGFDYHGDYVKESHSIISKDGANWFQARNNVEWDEDGVFFNKTLQYDYFNNFGIQNDIVIGRQHFDNGTEDLHLDITNYINKVISEDLDFYGIGLAFSPTFERETIDNKYIGFFTNNTSTFYLPYLETNNNNVILDDRAKFHKGMNNRLYFFVKDNGEYINLDKTPTCTINNKTYDVKQSRRGVYYIDIMIKKDEIEDNTILYDVWSDLYLNGQQLDDVEMEFVVLPMEKRIILGKSTKFETNYVPQAYGIGEKENIKIGDIREVFVDFIKEYSYGTKIIPNDSEYKVYVKENDREVIVYPYQKIERQFDEHSFIINTNELIPNTYYIDIKTKQGNSVKYFENVLEFKIISNVTNFYK